MLVGWAFTSFGEWEIAAPETFIPASGNDAMAIYDLPLLPGHGFPARHLNPSVLRGYVRAPESSPSAQLFPVRDPNRRECRAQKGAQKGNVKKTEKAKMSVYSRVRGKQAIKIIVVIDTCRILSPRTGVTQHVWLVTSLGGYLCHPELLT